MAVHAYYVYFHNKRDPIDVFELSLSKEVAGEMVSKSQVALSLCFTNRNRLSALSYDKSSVH